MRNPRLTATAIRSMHIAAFLLVATTLSGCVGYVGYPSQSYNYPNGYYAAYPRSYTTSYGYRPYYSNDYQR